MWLKGSPVSPKVFDASATVKSKDGPVGGADVQVVECPTKGSKSIFFTEERFLQTFVCILFFFMVNNSMGAIQSSGPLSRSGVSICAQISSALTITKCYLSCTAQFLVYRTPLLKNILSCLSKHVNVLWQLHSRVW